MFSIDRTSSVPIHRQLTEHLRYQIASGRYLKGAVLPSTRKLARELGISFHTVRKAYAILEQEHLITSRHGSGYVVTGSSGLKKSERVERGAEILQEGIRKLVSLGFAYNDIELLMSEQLDLMGDVSLEQKVIVVAPFIEMGERTAHQISEDLHISVDQVTYDELSTCQDADFVLAPFPLVQPAMRMLPHVDVIGIHVYPSSGVLDRLSRLLPSETLGIITLRPQGMAPMMESVRHFSGFSGQMVGASVNESHLPLADLIRQSDLIIYSPQARRRIFHHLKEETHMMYDWHVSSESLEMLRSVIARQ